MALMSAAGSGGVVSFSLWWPGITPDIDERRPQWR